MTTIITAFVFCFLHRNRLLVVATDAVIIITIIIAVDDDAIISRILLIIVAVVVTRAEVIGVFVSMSVDMSALVFVANN